MAVPIEAALLTFLAAGVGFWVAFATLPRFRESMQRLPGEPGCLGLFVLGTIALALAAGSAMLGKTWMGAGVIIEDLEPIWFWNVVKFQFGVGCVFIMLGVFKGKGSP
jgi:hypothetical protein